MNIVKIKDISVDSVPVDLREMFKHFKGKYCYAVNWNWLVLFDNYSNSDYVYCCKNNWVNGQLPYALFQVYYENDLIDQVETSKINDRSKWEEFNKFTPSEQDLTLDDIKRFRTWLAETLYNLLKDTEKFETVEMLKYYANEMTDDTIKHLSTFTPNTTVNWSTAATKTCSCNTTLSTTASVSTCNPIEMYMKGIYDRMVSVFSEIDFWMEREDQLLKEFKKYIDYIIKFNLPLIASKYVSDFYDCGCLNNRDSAQEALMQILKDLSKSLQFMINTKDSTYTGEDVVSGHKNFIADTLLAWSSKLYEVMRW